jgi:hypothetical protein
MRIEPIGEPGQERERDEVSGLIPESLWRRQPLRIIR